MKSFKMALGAVLLVVLAACSKGSGDSDTTATTAVSNYTINNGLCYNSNGQNVDYGNCTSISNYYQVNSYCYNPTGARVADNYCRSNNSLTLQPRQCNDGRFFMPRQGKMVAVNCRDRNCRDSLMFDQRGNAVHCR